MKKLISVALVMFSPFTFAFSQGQVKLPVQEKQPAAIIRVFDNSVKPYKIIEGKKLSRSKPRHLCLYILNVDLQERNLLAQYVQAPAPIKVNVPNVNAKVRMEDNQKNFLIMFDMMKKDIRNNTPTLCWALGTDDPIGIYKLDVQFNNVVFENLEFELLK
ncbi:hypothetical protein [Histophilus somni]|uniref:hypothetical protein n=1 Tax=Histophilus somni TaxID=731 RepID=UPI00109C2EF2|nr:hypothetical protein [Histophilus somni]QEH17903.1 hypothetical protein FWK48_04675 [Histophilus somni]THA22360.1 hypothetical protein E5361_00460 [Histophilus somni]